MPSHFTVNLVITLIGVVTLSCIGMAGYLAMQSIPSGEYMQAAMVGLGMLGTMLASVSAKPKANTTTTVETTETNKEKPADV